MKIVIFKMSSQIENGEMKQLIEAIEDLGHQVHCILNEENVTDKDCRLFAESDAILVLDQSTEAKMRGNTLSIFYNKKIFFSLEELEDYTEKNQKLFPGCCYP